MKKSIICWAVAIGCYSALFYNQSWGINTIVFALVVIVLLLCNKPNLLYAKHWRFAALAYIMAATAVAWHASEVSIMSYLLSFWILVGMCFEAKSSLPVAFGNGLIASTFVGFMANIGLFRAAIRRIFQRYLPFIPRTKISIFILPVAITVVFYWLYSLANPDFMIQFSWPSFNFNLNWWLIITISWGAIWLTPLFFEWGLTKITMCEVAMPNDLVRQKPKKTKTKLPTLGLLTESRQAVIMFMMLNILIAVFLVFNCWQIFQPIHKKLAEQVHEGFYTLIISIVLAICLIMYYFRGNQNFFRNNQKLVQLALVWLVLNVGLALFTFYKNTIYVHALGLTYLRLWVYIGLALTAIGLFITYLKIKLLKTNEYLIRQNAWVVYGFIVCGVLVDWDRVITAFNLKYAQNTDFEYLYSLGPTVAPQLVAFDKTIETQAAKNQWNSPYSPFIKYNRLLDEMKNTDWRSQSVDYLWLKSEMEKRN